MLKSGPPYLVKESVIPHQAELDLRHVSQDKRELELDAREQRIKSGKSK